MNEYDAWNTTKQTLNISTTFPDVREREIRWCSIGKNIGQEINGKSNVFTRPIIIVKKLSPYSVLVAPLTSKIKNGSWYVPIDFKGYQRTVCINQIRIIDTKRLGKYIARATTSNIEIIRKSIKKLYLTSTPSICPSVEPTGK